MVSVTEHLRVQPLFSERFLPVNSPRSVPRSAAFSGACFIPSLECARAFPDLFARRICHPRRLSVRGQERLSTLLPRQTRNRNSAARALLSAPTGRASVSAPPDFITTA